MDLIELPAVMDHEMDRIIHCDSEGDGRDHGCPNIERDAQKPHQTKIEHDGDNVGKQGYKSSLEGHKQGGVDETNDKERLAEPCDLIHGHVVRRVVDKNALTRELNFQIFGKVFVHVGLGLLQELRKLGRAGDVMADGYIHRGIVKIHILTDLIGVEGQQILGDEFLAVRDDFKIGFTAVHLPMHHADIVGKELIAQY